MHGFIFGELKKMVDAKLGGDGWRRIMSEAGLGAKLYMSVGEYPDSDAAAIVSAVAASTGLAPKAVLEGFGEFIAVDLLSLYGHLVKPAWRTLDVLENTEETIHRVVRTRNPGAKPPQLTTVRDGNDVVITYSSKRRMCGVAIGIVRGLARHYGESVRVDELSCMANGAPACRIRATKDAAKDG